MSRWCCRQLAPSSRGGDDRTAAVSLRRLPRWDTNPNTGCCFVLVSARFQPSSPPGGTGPRSMRPEYRVGGAAGRPDVQISRLASVGTMSFCVVGRQPLVIT